MRSPIVVALAVSMSLAACGIPKFEAPPEHPTHDRSEDGAMHARRYEEPFLCGVDGRDDKKGEACPPQRPKDDLLSCDASGCHGNYEFDAMPAGVERKLFGSDGPSCYTCHGEEWD